MGGEWIEVPIGAIAEVFDGPHATPAKTESGPIFLGISNLDRGRLNLAQTEHLSEDDWKRWTRRVTPFPGDVVFSYETRIGEAAFIPEELKCCLGRRMGLLRARPGKIEPRFLLYAYLGPQFQKVLRSRTVHGSTVDRIPLIEMSEFPILVPKRQAVQRAIACILGSLDDKIELNRRMNRALEEMARAIFKSWFIDFDPVRAKAAVHRQHPKWTDEQVSRAACPKLKPEIARLFPDSFEPSELGEIPKGWKVKTIGDLAEIVGGSTPRTTEAAYWESGTHAWATPKDLSKLSVPILFETERRITDDGLAQISSGLLPVGTVLLSSRAPIGYLAIAEVPLAVNQGFIAMKPRDGVSNLYLLFWARSAHEQIISRANGSTFLEVSKSSFRLIPLVAPPPKVFAAFEHLAKPLFARLVSNERESRTLAALRDALLPKLMSGELRIPDAERIAGRCA